MNYSTRNPHNVVSSTLFHPSPSATHHLHSCILQSQANSEMHTKLHELQIRFGPERKCNLPLLVLAKQRGDQLKQFVLTLREKEAEKVKRAAFAAMERLNKMDRMETPE